MRETNSYSGLQNIAMTIAVAAVYDRRLFGAHRAPLQTPLSLCSEIHSRSAVRGRRWRHGRKHSAAPAGKATAGILRRPKNGASE